ncbi:MAG: methyltransferase domain-containing protein [Methylococcales bacterium]
MPPILRPTRQEVTTSDYQLVESFLDYLIDPNECIDTYGRSYLSDLEFIAIENFYFDRETQLFPDPDIQQVFGKICQTYGLKSLGDLAEFVRIHPSIRIANLRPRMSFKLLKEFESGSKLSGLAGGPPETAIALNNEFQKIWSTRAIQETPISSPDVYELYLGADRLNPWTFLFKRAIACRMLSRDARVVCIGPRWNSEILYFRKNLGLTNTIGVDLVSNDPDLVVTADMHNLPFANSSVDLIFCRGTIDKSYDIRVLAAEMVRVIKDGGLLAIETIGPYWHGVNPLGRTDVKNSKNLRKLFKGKVAQVIYEDDYKLGVTQSAVTNAIRMFIQICKSHVLTPKLSVKFPKLLFSHFNAYRKLLLRARIRWRRLVS